jgi:hypothetical protein
VIYFGCMSLPSTRLSDPESACCPWFLRQKVHSPNTSRGHSIGVSRRPFPVRLNLSHLEMLGLLQLDMALWIYT